MIARARRGPALIAFRDPPDRAVEQLVGEPLARDPHRRRPAEPKGGALRFVAELIGGAGRHRHAGGSDLDRSGDREMGEEVALGGGGPVIAGRRGGGGGGGRRSGARRGGTECGKTCRSWRWASS